MCKSPATPVNNRWGENMFIVHQSKTGIINLDKAVGLQISCHTSQKQNFYKVSAVFAKNDDFPIGKYPDEESAKMALASVFTGIINDDKILIMPQAESVTAKTSETA